MKVDRCQKRRSPRGGGLTAQDEVQENGPKSSDDPREVQGIQTKRNRDQKPPTWSEPPESVAMRLLERLWGRS